MRIPLPHITTRFILPFILVLMVLTALPVPAMDVTIIRRAAFDIGSANIKCTVADVDPVSGSIVNIVDNFTAKVDFAEDLARSYNGNLSREIMAAGKAVMEQFKARALKDGAKTFSAVGGGVFREARNGRAYFATLKMETGIPCRILSKQQAALLGFHAARIRENLPDKGLLVWDIGASIMTMTARNRGGGLNFHIDKMASIPFRNAVIGTIQGHDVTRTTSPNPMSLTDVDRALELVQAHAQLNVSPALSNRLRSGILHVVGLGGVHYYAIPQLMEKRPSTYTRREVKAALKAWTGKDDSAFNSEFASSRLTNLILVLGYMNALGIETVTPLKVNQTEGLLVAPEFWRS